MLSLPFDIVTLIFSYLSRWQIYQVSKYFHGYYQSEYYREFLIGAIKKDMKLKFEKYSLEQLENLFLMMKETHFYECFFLNKGNIHFIDTEKKEITLIPSPNNFIQINSYFLDDKGDIHSFDRLSDVKGIDRCLGPKNVVRLLGDNVLLDNKGNSQKFDVGTGEWEILPSIPKIIKYDSYHLSDEGVLYSRGGKIMSPKCFIQTDVWLLLDDEGVVYSISSRGEIERVSTTGNIIQIVDHFGGGLALDNQGKVFYFTTNCLYPKPRPKPRFNTLEFNNIVEISASGKYFLALNNVGNIYSIDTENNLKISEFHSSFEV